MPEPLILAGRTVTEAQVQALLRAVFAPECDCDDCTAGQDRRTNVACTRNAPQQAPAPQTGERGGDCFTRLSQTGTEAGGESTPPAYGPIHVGFDPCRRCEGAGGWLREGVDRSSGDWDSEWDACPDCGGTE